MALSLLSPPLAGPIPLADAKAWLRIEHDDDDASIASLLDACTLHLEAVAGIRLITQSWRQYADAMPHCGTLRLEAGPVRQVTAMRWFDANGDGVEVPAESIILDKAGTPPRLRVLENIDPAPAINGIEIDLLVGFGDTGNEVPDNLKRALLLLLAHAYEFRGAVAASAQPASEPHGFRTLLAPYRRVLM